MTGLIPCPHCGYDLRGGESSRCPECGQPVDRTNASTIPWAHRRPIGRFKAYVRTVLAMTLRPRRRMGTGPGDLDDAVGFRRVTTTVVAVALLVPATIAAFVPQLGGLNDALAQPAVWWVELLCLPVVWVATWLAIHAATGVGANGFRPRSLSADRRRDSVGFGQYACGPLALLVVPAAFLLLLVATAPVTDRYPTAATAVGLLTTPLAIVVAMAWVRTTAAVVGETTGCGFIRKAVVAVGLPVTAAVAVVGIGLGLPAVYLWLAVVVRSLT